jgi:hypothetical protein
MLLSSIVDIGFAGTQTRALCNGADIAVANCCASTGEQFPIDETLLAECGGMEYPILLDTGMNTVSVSSCVPYFAFTPPLTRCHGRLLC